MNSRDSDEFYSSEQFQAFFEKSPQSLILRADSLKFTVLAVSGRYLSLTHKKRSELLGKSLFEVFPGSSADSSEGFSVLSSFTRVIASRSPDELPVFKYEIFVPEAGGMQTQYWTNLNEPVLDDGGEVAYIINTTTNITGQILSRQTQERAIQLEKKLSREQILNAELSTANEELHAINEELHRSQQELAQLNFELEERVAARTKALSDSEMMMRTAITSANLGTWFINAQTREFVPSDRMKALFGFQVNEAMSIKAAMNQISEAYREQVNAFFESTIDKGGLFNMEYPVIGFTDKKLRWLRSMGEMYQGGLGKPAHFSGTVMDITESKMDEIRKNDFIAMVSHELKTPLTSLKAYVQMLAGKAKKADDSFTAEALNKVNQQVKKMTVMINSFLNVSRLESGKIYLEKKDFNLAGLIRESVEEISLTTKSHPIDFHPCEPIMVHADEEKIGQVIGNLLSNAVKYSPAGKQIDVSCGLITGMAQVRVKDEGEGVQAQDVEKIFDRFYRVKSQQSQTVSGFGIGLYLCAEIIQRHNGTISVESNSGQGSTFYFDLPLS